MKSKHVVALLALVSACAIAQDITYKGVPLGASMEELRSKLPDHECFASYCLYSRESCGGRLNGISKEAVEEYSKALESCKERNSFGGALVLSVRSSFRDGKLTAISISFPSNQFDSLVGAITERSGQPTNVIDKPFQTRAGAIFENREATWEQQKVMLVVERHGSKLTEGFAMLTTPEERARRAAEDDAKRKAGAKDF